MERIIFDLLTLTYCQHPSPQRGIDYDTLLKILRIISNRIHRIKFMLSKTQYKRYIGTIFQGYVREEQVRIITTLLSNADIVSNKINMRCGRHCNEYRELGYMIQKYFVECHVNEIFICLDRNFNINHLINLIGRVWGRCNRSTLRTLKNASPHYVRKE